MSLAYLFANVFYVLFFSPAPIWKMYPATSHAEQYITNSRYCGNLLGIRSLLNRIARDPGFIPMPEPESTKQNANVGRKKAA